MVVTIAVKIIELIALATANIADFIIGKIYKSTDIFIATCICITCTQSKICLAVEF